MRARIPRRGRGRPRAAVRRPVRNPAPPSHNRRGRAEARERRSAVRRPANRGHRNVVGNDGRRGGRQKDAVYHASGRPRRASLSSAADGGLRRLRARPRRLRGYRPGGGDGVVPEGLRDSGRGGVILRRGRREIRRGGGRARAPAPDRLGERPVHHRAHHGRRAARHSRRRALRPQGNLHWRADERRAQVAGGNGVRRGDVFVLRIERNVRARRGVRRTRRRSPIRLAPRIRNRDARIRAPRRRAADSDDAASRGLAAAALPPGRRSPRAPRTLRLRARRAASGYTRTPGGGRVRIGIQTASGRDSRHHTARRRERPPANRAGNGRRDRRDAPNRPRNGRPNARRRLNRHPARA